MASHSQSAGQTDFVSYEIWVYAPVSKNLPPLGMTNPNITIWVLTYSQYCCVVDAFFKKKTFVEYHGYGKCIDNRRLRLSITCLKIMVTYQN
jgi:hypothetical protein